MNLHCFIVGVSNLFSIQINRDFEKSDQGAWE